MAFDFIKYSVLSVDFLAAVGMGKVPGVSLLDKFGNNTKAGTTEVAVWAGGANDATFAWPAAAQGMRMACGNNAATHSITAEFLNANYATQTVTATLTGTTPVNLGTYLYLNRAYCSEPGRLIGNLPANVQIFGSGASGGGTVTDTDMLMGVIPAAANAYFNQTEQAIYTVPDNQNLLIYGYWGGIDESSGVSAVAADFRLYVGNAGYPMLCKRVFGQTNLGGNPYHMPMGVPLLVGSRASVELRAICDATNLDVGAGFYGLLIDR